LCPPPLFYFYVDSLSTPGFAPPQRELFAFLRPGPQLRGTSSLLSFPLWFVTRPIMIQMERLATHDVRSTPPSFFLLPPALKDPSRSHPANAASPNFFALVNPTMSQLYAPCAGPEEHAHNVRSLRVTRFFPQVF